MKHIFIFLLAATLTATTLKAQWIDDFMQGLDNWTGTKEYFCADDSLLRSCGPQQASSLYLLRQINLNSLRQWEFAVSLSFNPSSTNYLRMYLWADNDTASLAQNALYIMLGETGGKNNFRLYLSENGNDSLIASGKTTYSSTNGCAFKLRIIQDKGYVKMYSAPWGKYDWNKETDSVYLQSPTSSATQHTGIYLKYSTATRFDRYAFDYISYGIAIPDPEPEPEPTPPDSGMVKFSEILFDVETGESKFIEIYNDSDSIIALSTLAFAIENKTGYRLYPLTDNLLQPNSYAAFAQDPESLSNKYTSCIENIFQSQTFPTLNASEGTLYLCRIQDTIILEKLYYSKDFHHILLPQAKGVSLERIRFDIPSLTVENWHSASLSCGYATPGCPNSQENKHENKHQENDNAFSISPELITPNNDGLNDYTEISWNLPLNGYVATIKVFDDYGREVSTLKKSEIIAPQDQILYHAKDSKGNTLRKGIYIIMFELIHPDTGKKKNYRKIFAIG
ncbi:MAG: gliding motility-associated C-terminal domain-containing protein [Bacteroidales bacterium]|jgi:hypothetical protein|nr:gliding motility-associated C-terminal domain-containing protein [Bacteroidales bacterium]